MQIAEILKRFLRLPNTPLAEEENRKKEKNFFIDFNRSCPDIRWKSYKNTAKNQTKKGNIKIYENRMLLVMKVSIELTKNGKKKKKQEKWF